VMLAGAATALVTPASAAVGVTLGVGPGYMAPCRRSVRPL
jgi:hypothetical protein